MNNSLTKGQCALMVVDVQDRLFPHITQKERLLESLIKVITGFSVLDIPILVSEQVPAKMGRTLPELRYCLDENQEYFEKTSFSCIGDPSIHGKVLELGRKKMVLVGVESHVCVLQTARDLIAENFEVTVLKNAISSRSLEDHLSAIDEMRLMGVRISTVETVLFELLQNARAVEFRKIKDIVK